MAEIIMLHSFRRGVGRTLVAANLAATIAAQGYRVGLVDADFELPEIHLVFNLDQTRNRPTLNDVLWKADKIDQATTDVSAVLPTDSGCLFIVQAASQPQDISAALHAPLNMEVFSAAMDHLIETNRLDYLLIDCSAGLDEKTMPMLALADTLLVLLRPDQQEYQGTALLVEIGSRLNIPHVYVVTNEVSDSLDRASIIEEVRRVFHAECIAILPHQDLPALHKQDALMVFNQPDNQISLEIKKLAGVLTQAM
jgi:MinD-like ATPase involved in chromosome partitioning or flagellar assembly